MAGIEAQVRKRRRPGCGAEASARPPALALASIPRVTLVLGTRPEAIKLAPVIRAFQTSPRFETRVVLTGQHREMVAQVMALFGLRPSAIWP